MVTDTGNTSDALDTQQAACSVCKSVVASEALQHGLCPKCVWQAALVVRGMIIDARNSGKAGSRKWHAYDRLLALYDQFVLPLARGDDGGRTG